MQVENLTFNPVVGEIPVLNEDHDLWFEWYVWWEGMGKGPELFEILWEW